MFSLGYYLVLQSDGSLEEMFPSFNDSVIDSNKDADSKIAQTFSRAYELLYHITQSYKVDAEERKTVNDSISQYCLDNMAPDVKAHGPKKLGVQTLGDLLTITIQDISMRAGWVLKSFNTFFDYWVGSLPSSVRSGKMISGWTTVLNQSIHGGNPPNLRDVKTECSKLNDFVNNLIVCHKHIVKEVKELIVANLLRHWDETIDVIRSEPNGKYNGEKFRTHPFVSNVYTALAYSNATPATFKIWVKEIRQAFILKNILSMDKEQCLEVGYDNCCID